MSGKSLLLSAGLLLGAVTVTAAQENTQPVYAIRQIENDLQKGIELYNNRLYVAALKEFERVEDYARVHDLHAGGKVDLVQAEGYQVLCKIMLRQPNIEGAVKEYTDKYPYSPLLSRIQFKQGIFYFDNGEFARTAAIFRDVDRRSLSPKERDEYDFRKGYCLMRTGDNPGAIAIFAEIIRPGRQTKSAYTNPALYYLGYIHYINKDFPNAIPLFERAVTDPRFAALAGYHLLESKFMLKEYNYVITNGGAVYESMSDDYKPKVARILSESYYALNEPAKAKYYYEIYSINSPDISRNDHFYAGMISYTLGSHISAIDAFLKVASATDSIGQSAYYHAGQCYIQLKNKHAAQEAFRNAAQSNFDQTIREDAYFNYAKLTFDLTRDITPFSEYLAAYPANDLKWDEVHQYMSTAFILGKEYEKAIGVLQKIRRGNPATTAQLQKASFFRGIELIERGSFGDAAAYFQQAVKYGAYNPALTNLSQFWLAECYYRGDKFGQSLDILNGLLKNNAFRQSAEYPIAMYNRGYARFKLGDFTGAAEDFKNYLNFPYSKIKYPFEAQTRLADSYFMNKDYQQAAELFERLAVDNFYNDLYPPLQGAIAYGLLSQDEKKIALLKEITTNRHAASPLYTTALYELGRTLVQNVKDEEAEKVLAQLITQPKDSTYYYKALLEMGMINANMQKPEKALGYYKAIIARKPVSEEGQSALAGIENIYSAQNKPQEFLDYLDNLGLSTTKTAGERESMLFNSAEQIYLGGNYTSALNALSSFLAKYPLGAYTQQANFYIAECYQKLNKPEQAANAYYKVMMSGEGAFSEIATLHYGRLTYQLEKYREAIKAYETLGRIAVLENNKLEAQVGKTRSYFKDNQYETAVTEANKLLAVSNLDKLLKTEADYIKAKSLLALGERDGALKLLKELAKNPMGKEGAEAAYLLINDAYDAGDFAAVEKQVFALSDSKTPQTYWLAMSFILLGDSYAEQGNLEQAKATFNSIKENYKSQKSDHIGELIKIRLNKLK